MDKIWLILVEARLSYKNFLKKLHERSHLENIGFRQNVMQKLDQGLKLVLTCKISLNSVK